MGPMGLGVRREDRSMKPVLTETGAQPQPAQSCPNCHQSKSNPSGPGSKFISMQTTPDCAHSSAYCLWLVEKNRKLVWLLLSDGGHFKARSSARQRGTVCKDKQSTHQEDTQL